MHTIEDPAAMTAWAASVRAAGHTVGFVPTMGSLHRGHTSLMALMRPRVDRLVVSIYVNPLQFGPDEDLDVYPCDPEGDASKCREQGVDCVFMPPDLYPDGFATSVSVHGLTEGLCGAGRPGHFEGVTTVVARLFGVVQCSSAAFGEKDYQQLQVIRQMVRDLALPIDIVPGPLVRDHDGLALSSRNKYLSSEARARALTLHRALGCIQQAHARGEGSVDALLAVGRQALVCDRLDYLEIVDAESLVPVADIVRPARAMVAAFYGETRLIDNVGL